MKILSLKIHGYLDYAVVAWFLAAPMLFSLTGIAATISYVAIIHLGLTALTAFPLSVIKVIPLKFHGAIVLCCLFCSDCFALGAGICFGGSSPHLHWFGNCHFYRLANYSLSK